MWKVLTGEALKWYKKKNRYIWIKIMDKYAQLKRFHHYHWLQFYMYTVMYVDPDVMPVEGYFPNTETFSYNYKKMSALGPVPKH